MPGPRGMTKAKKKVEEKEDVIELLIRTDKTLVRRDIESKLYKLRNKKHLRKRIFKFKENYEEEEQFKKWWTPELPNVYFAMYSRHRTCYKKGDQLLNSYGRRNNRFLLTNYGFAIRSNKYNSLGFKVFVKYESRGADDHYFEKLLKVKRERLSEDLLQYLRANVIFTYRKKHGKIANGFL